MQPGMRDRLITIERFSETRNDLNEAKETWAELFKVWAKVAPISDSERSQAAQKGVISTDRFNIRWSVSAATIKHNDRINYGGVPYDIQAIKEIGRRKALELTASASKNG